MHEHISKWFVKLMQDNVHPCFNKGKLLQSKRDLVRRQIMTAWKFMQIIFGFIANIYSNFPRTSCAQTETCRSTYPIRLGLRRLQSQGRLCTELSARLHRTRTPIPGPEVMAAGRCCAATSPVIPLPTTPSLALHNLCLNLFSPTVILSPLCCYY